MSDPQHQKLAISVLRLRLSLAGLVGLQLLGTVGYKLVEEQYTWFDAFYMTLITISTVGFTEVHELDGSGRLVTVGLIMTGLFLVAFATGSFIESIVEGNLAKHFGRRRLERQIAALRDHWIICGYGRIGEFVVRELLFAGRQTPFVVVDNDPERCVPLERDGLLYVVADATQDETLEQAGIARAAGLLSLVDTDAENVFICLTAREMNPKLKIIAGAHDLRAEPKLLRAGADKVISPYRLGGMRLSQAILRPRVQDFLDFATGHELDVELEEIKIPSSSTLVGLALKNTDLRNALDLIVLAMERGSGEMIFNPGPAEVVKEDDTLIVMGRADNLEALKARC